MASIGGRSFSFSNEYKSPKSSDEIGHALFNAAGMMNRHRQVTLTFDDDSELKETARLLSVNYREVPEELARLLTQARRRAEMNDSPIQFRYNLDLRVLNTY